MKEYSNCGVDVQEFEEQLLQLNRHFFQFLLGLQINNAYHARSTSP